MKILNLRKAMAPMQKINFLCVTAIAAVAVSIITGCSSTNPASPATPGESARDASSTTHQLWGLYEITVDFNTREAEVVPLRQASLRLNALPFLEPPAMTDLYVTNVSYTDPTPMTPGFLFADVHITNPYLGATEYTGFDVKGIVFGHEIINYDGITRWWNPVEFTGTGIMGFKKGLLGYSDTGYFTDIYNDYKYFSYGLSLNDSLSDPGVIGNVIASRGHFPVGATISRHYEMIYGYSSYELLRFQYAVDASWQMPTGEPPYTPDEFPPGANQAEAWNVTTTVVENTLNWYDDEGTGDLIVDIAVYDWQGFGDTTVSFSCDEIGVFSPIYNSIPKSILGDYAIYRFEIYDATPNYWGNLPLTISVESSDKVYGQGNPWGVYPTGYVTSRWRMEVPVLSHPPSQTDCEGTLHAKDPLGQAWTVGLTLDEEGSSPVWDMAYEYQGAQAGYVIYPYHKAGENDNKVTALKYFDSDKPISNAEQGTFYEIPPDEYCDFVWSIDCDPNDGRVIYVGSNKPSTFIAIDSTSNKLAEVDLGDQIIAIQALCIDDMSNLWLLSLRTTMFEPSYELRSYAQVDGPPFYVQTTYTDISPYQPFSLLSFIYDMDYNYQSKRLYIFDMDGGTSDTGAIQVFDINTSGIPQHNANISKEGIFPFPVDLLPEGPDGRHHWYYHVAWGGDIFIDHSAGDNERCRITTMACIDDDSSDGPTLVHWTLWDEDLQVVDEYNDLYDPTLGSKCWDTFAVNPDENANIAAMFTTASWEYAPAPAGW